MRRAGSVVALFILLVPAAWAKAPRTATITPNVGMDGVRIGQFGKVLNRDGKQMVRGRRTRSYGRVFRFCLEGDQCAWRVRGGHFLTLTLNAIADRVIGLGTDAPGWSTPEGIHPGSAAADVEAAYPSAKLLTRCIAPAGAPVTGYRLRGNGNVTLFSLNKRRTRVDRIHVVERALRCR